MKFFIDTANLDQIREAQALGILDGVTTNPSLMAKEGIAGDNAVKAHYKAICEIVDGDVSAEVISTDFEGMVREGEALAALHENIVVKVPMIPEGIKAISHFTENGIRSNCTLIFSPGQALIAAKAGASYVSPFIGRLDAIRSDGMDLHTHIRTIIKHTKNKIRIEDFNICDFFNITGSHNSWPLFAEDHALHAFAVALYRHLLNVQHNICDIFTHTRNG